MASNILNCHLCHKVMEDSESSIKHHLSSFHVKYWPYSCSTWEGSIYKEATEEAMEEHIATFHSESNLGYYVPKKTEKGKKKDAELKTAIAQCRRFSTFQITSTNPTNAFHQNLNFIHNETTGSENYIGNEQILNNSNDNLRQVSISASSLTAVDTPTENELVPIGVKYEGFYYAIPSEVNANDEAIAHDHSDCSIQSRNNELLDQQHCAVNSPENVTESEPPMAPASLSEPTTILETNVLNERFVDAMNSCEHNTALNAEILTKPEPSQDTSAVALGLQTALSAFVSIDVDANKGQLDYDAKNTFCEPSISRKKRTHIDVAFSNSDASARKRSNQNPTTAAQVPVDAPNDPAQKLKIKKIWIGLRSGNASFETSQGQCHDFRPLTGYMSLLRQSEADVLGCDAYIRYQTPRNIKAGKVVMHAKSVIATRQKFEKFSQEMHSISHLWANGRVEADLWEYFKHANEVVPVSNFCDEFFSQDRSILACKELEIRIDNSWPFSVVTNIANRCNKLVFEEFKYSVPDQRLHYHILDAIYEMKLPQHIVLTLKLHLSESGKQFIDELKKRFERSTGQCFKVQLISKREISKYNKHERSVRNSEIPNMVLLNDYGTLETKTLPYNSHHHDNVMIEQRTFLIG